MEKFNIQEPNSLDSMEGIEDSLGPKIEGGFDISPEVEKSVMKKVKDINKYGTAFSIIGDWENLQIGKEDSKFQSILRYGLIGRSPKRKNGTNSSFFNENKVEDYVSDLEETKNDTEKHTPQVFFSIVGRNRNLAENCQSIENYSYYWGYGDYLAIIFEVSDFREKILEGYFSKSGEEHVVNKGTYSPHRFDGYQSGKDPVADKKYYQYIGFMNKRGDIMSDSEYGFKLSPRVKPRNFKGIIFNPIKKVIKEGKIYFEKETNAEALRKRANQIASDMCGEYYDKKDNLIPVYDIYGNMWWPKEMSHEDIVQIEEKDTSNTF